MDVVLEKQAQSNRRKSLLGYLVESVSLWIWFWMNQWKLKKSFP